MQWASFNNTEIFFHTYRCQLFVYLINQKQIFVGLTKDQLICQFR